MLKEQDKIFTNLYGFQSNNLESSKQRGDWSQTKKFIDFYKDCCQRLSLKYMFEHIIIIWWVGYFIFYSLLLELGNNLNFSLVVVD